MEKKENALINLTGLWINEGKNGKKFMAGSMGGARLLIFKNDKKRDGSKDPDYYACIGASEPREQKEKAKESDNDF